MLLPGASEGVWPTTVTGWIALVVSGGAALAMMYSHAKGLARLNGFGGRMTEIEKEQEATRAREQTYLTTLEKVLATQASLLEKLGDAKRTSEQCDDDMRTFATEIGSKIHAMDKNLSERLTRVETVLDLRKRSTT